MPKEAWNSAYLAEGLQPLVDAMKSRVSSKATAPPVLVLFTIDEVDGLSSVTVDSGSTCYDIFLSALQGFRPHNPYFIITLSTHPHLDLRAPTLRHVSCLRDVRPDTVKQGTLDRTAL